MFDVTFRDYRDVQLCAKYQVCISESYEQSELKGLYINDHFRPWFSKCYTGFNTSYNVYHILHTYACMHTQMLYVHPYIHNHAYIYINAYIHKYIHMSQDEWYILNTGVTFEILVDT